MDYECDAVISHFIKETGRIGPTIYSKAAPTSPWIAATPRAEWQDGMGIIQKNLMWERTVPTNDGDEWTDLTTSDGASEDACVLTPELLEFGQTERTMRLQRRNIQTDDFCVEDLRSDFMIEKTLNGVIDNLKYASKYVWENRDQDEYIRLAEHKVTEKAVIDLNATSFDAGAPPTSRLTLGTLEQIYQWLIYDGAEAVGMTGGNAPIFSLFTDMNTSQDLIRQDPEVREDFRYANPGALTAPLGAARSHAGFKHVFNAIQPRWDIVGGEWVRRMPFKNPEATTKGKKQDINPTYIYAEYADSIVHVKNVFTQRVPRPIGKLGPIKFNPVNYMGDFQFLVILDKLCNPRGQKGFFDAVFASASDPGHTEFGFVVRHKSCPPMRHLKTSCYS